MHNKDYVLASGSPRRIQMMKEHGLNPIICPADIEENLPRRNERNCHVSVTEKS